MTSGGLIQVGGYRHVNRQGFLRTDEFTNRRNSSSNFINANMSGNKCISKRFSPGQQNFARPKVKLDNKTGLQHRNTQISKPKAGFFRPPRLKPHLHGASSPSFPRRGKLDRVNDFPRQVFLAEKLACTAFERGSLIEDRVNGIARKTRRGSPV